MNKQLQEIKYLRLSKEDKYLYDILDNTYIKTTPLYPTSFFYLYDDQIIFEYDMNKMMILKLDIFTDIYQKHKNYNKIFEKIKQYYNLNIDKFQFSNYYSGLKWQHANILFNEYKDDKNLNLYV